MSDVRHVDGNAVAGLLVEIFGQEMTASRGQCGGCGRIDVLANVMVYRDAPGDVLRCPACGDVGLRIATLPDRHVVVLSGTWSIAVPRA